MKNLNRHTAIAVIFLLAVVFLTRCTPLDSSLDGKILKDEDGNIYKLEWQKGQGATWAFKYPVTRIYKGDTVVVWEYYRQLPAIRNPSQE